MDQKREYWLGFSRVPGIGPVRLNQLLEYFGDIAAAWHASQAELLACGLPPKQVSALLSHRSSLNLKDEIERLSAAGFDLVPSAADDYPANLRQIDAAPAVLYRWGEFTPKDKWAVAIVGTRRASPYGQAVAEQLASELANSGVTVVSGLARGVDGIAHTAALEAGGRTIGVLGSGLDRIYPPDHRRLAARMARAGAVVSDYPLGAAPEPGNFPPRNRIISGLSLAVIVVEAGESSGALITAAFAAEQGREVFAVPGSIHAPTSKGCNRLIQNGAHPLLAVGDVLEAINLEAAIERQAVQRALPENEMERKLVESLSSEPIHIDELQRQLGMPISDISSNLAVLELKGHVRQVGGMRYVLARESRTPYSLD